MVKSKLTTGNMSDVSTTALSPINEKVRSPSGRPSPSQNFAELGAGLITDSSLVTQQSNDMYPSRPAN